MGNPSVYQQDLPKDEVKALVEFQSKVKITPAVGPQHESILKVAGLHEPMHEQGLFIIVCLILLIQRHHM